MAGKFSVTDLKQQLKGKTHPELVEEIAALYKRFPQIKEYCQAAFSGYDDSAILQKYKDIVKGELVPGFKKNLPSARLSVARKAIADYKKVSGSKYGWADIMLTFVESGVIFTNEFGDINEPFYNSMEGMYQSVLKHLLKENMLADFDSRLLAVLKDTRHIGWGFHENLCFLYEEHCGYEPEF
ncbi:hypothetical protein KFZ76_13450 [Methylovulum psychrotolerans]|uniref:DUF6155 family protein n=1 Tax=Methylovulum psychrotolerans TaxID=1704499 RepID=UPI001BFF18AB|nr:DUF6155 family protein [Methylovulum psychrotolerans]MBT9098709.1 hypothetical protein [Methylovulum psychrotolerans]